jgi:hypothetical protein
MVNLHAERSVRATAFSPIATRDGACEWAGHLSALLRPIGITFLPSAGAVQNVAHGACGAFRIDRRAHRRAHRRPEPCRQRCGRAASATELAKALVSSTNAERKPDGDVGAGHVPRDIRIAARKEALMTTMDSGVVEIVCAHCGAAHVAEYGDFPQKERGEQSCLRCGGLLKRWHGTRDYLDFKLRPDSHSSLNFPVRPM